MKKTMIAFSLAVAAALGAGAKTVNLPVYGKSEVIDEVDCTAADHQFADYPAGASKVEDVLGKACRVLPVQADKSSYLKWRLGEGKGLKPNGAYVVVIEYPDDGPRNYIVRNYGNNSRRSFYTGTATGDAWEANIVGHHPESLKIPQTGKYQAWTALTFLGEKASNLREDGKQPQLVIAKDGFDIVLAQYKSQHHPGTLGVAARRILLCEIVDEKAAYAKINFPPAPLPRRHIFWREEMADFEMGDGGLCPMNGGLDWIEQKFRTMKIFGQNTYMKDLLEFGHNQHWNCNWKHGQPGGKSAQWMWGSNGGNADVWSRAVPLAVDTYGFDILPYYEYAGAAGNPQFALGPQKRAEPLNLDNKPKDQKNYTHIWWSDGKLRVDITDPETLEELKYVLEGTILRFKEQVDKGGFVGAFFRPRPGAWPVSFADKTRARFAQEANGGAQVSRQDLMSNRALYDKYLAWFGQRRAKFLDDLRKYLEQNGVKNAITILENDVSEPGYGLADRPGLITDDVESWKKILPGKNIVDINEPAIVNNHLYLKALKAPAYTWGLWEWQHACPMTDPEKYTDLKNIWISMSFNNLFSVMDPYCLAAFRNGNGTATIVRHFGLNEHMVEDRLFGYAMADFERAGRACMIAEVEAMAKGDPVNLGYLMGSVYTRGFPAPVREFNLNFLALPALPSKIVAGASSDPEVTVREIDCSKQGQGTYYAIVHTGRTPKANVAITLPKGAKSATFLADGAPAALAGGTTLTLNLKPWQLLSLRR